MNEIFEDEESFSIKKNEIKEKLEDYILSIKGDIDRFEEIKPNEHIKLVKQKEGFIYVYLDTLLRGYDRVPITQLSSTYLIESYKAFQEIVLCSMRHGFYISCDKTIVCAYLGITTEEFNGLMQNADGDIRSAVAWINDSISGLGFSAAESGLTFAKATVSRLKTKAVGQGLKEEAQEVSVTTEVIRSAQDLDKILGTAKPKLIRN